MFNFNATSGLNARAYGQQDAAKTVQQAGNMAARATALSELQGNEAPTHIIADGSGHEVAVHVENQAQAAAFVAALNGLGDNVDLSSAAAQAAITAQGPAVAA